MPRRTDPKLSNPAIASQPRRSREAQMRAAAGGALGAALAAGLEGYDRHLALMRFHRLTPQVIASETREAAAAVVAELERALRSERARIGHWSYDLNRHIGLLVAHRAEKARLEGLSR